MKTIMVLLASSALITFSVTNSSASTVTGAHDIINPIITHTAPLIDGTIEDSVWGNPVCSDNLITFEPRYGDKFPMKTDVYVTYDEENLYFAFKCTDTEPDKIITSISKRDGIFSDDFVAVALDALGNSQSAYIFCLNPNGIQGDLLENGTGNDSSSDWVWDGASKITDYGYSAEMRIPLKSIQYTTDDSTPMRICFFRKIRRSNTFGSWPALKPSDSLLTNQQPVLFKGIKTVRKMEILPSVTYGRLNERTGASSWINDARGDVGVDFKYSLSSSMSLDSTINPDFSQVEADAFQVDVNRRYPIYNQEKRPFFMEVNSLFNVGGTGWGNNLIMAVHTRSIVDPSWSVKSLGSRDKTTYGILAAEDRWHDSDKSTGVEPRFVMARVKRSLANGSYIGGIYTGRSAGSDNNNVAGFDGSLRFRKDHLLAFSVLQSISSSWDSDTYMGGNMASVNYSYSTVPLYAGLTVENLTDQFRMDTAYMRRTGISRVGTYISPKYYPKSEKYPWINEISGGLGLDYVREHDTNAEDFTANLNLNTHYTRNGYVGMTLTRKLETWKGKSFTMNQFNISGNVQPVKWLQFGSWGTLGKGIYYDDDNPYLGRSREYGSWLDLRPGEKLYQSISYNHAQMKRPFDGAMEYCLDIINTRLTYQFNKYFFMRGIYMFNTNNKRQLVDYLASFTFIPGTVVQLGYGAMLEEGRWVNDEWEHPGNSALRTLNRSLFFKTSYRYVL